MQNFNQQDKGRDMLILTAQEKSFLDVFLHEATTPPFTGPATNVLHGIGVEYSDLPYLVWAYERDVPCTSFPPGHGAETAPPLPWMTREVVLRRNREIEQLWQRQRAKTGAVL
jgi:hypothetical protein